MLTLIQWVFTICWFAILFQHNIPLKRYTVQIASKKLGAYFFETKLRQRISVVFLVCFYLVALTWVPVHNFFVNAI